MVWVYVIALLCCVVVAQQVFFMRQIQKLLDKLMSRSYTEYLRAQEPKTPRIKIDNDAPEDLGILKEFSPLG